MIRHYWLRLICKIKGHKWIDTSVATPDYGDMAMDCERCGASFYHSLY